MADYDSETLRLLKASTKTTDALSERIASMSPLELSKCAMPYAKALADLDDACRKAFDAIEERTSKMQASTNIN